MNEFDLVVLQEDLESGKSKKGDIGTIIRIYNDHQAYEVEFATLAGKPLAVEILLPHQIRCVRETEVMAVRELTA